MCLGFVRYSVCVSRHPNSNTTDHTAIGELMQP